MNNNQETLRQCFNGTSLDDLQIFMSYFGDDEIWRPFCNEKEGVKKFEFLIEEINNSQTWNIERNKEKGNLLEELMKFLFSRFVNHLSCNSLRKKDNEIDVNITFNEILSPPFIKDLKLHFICECKNKASGSVDVGMVAKLVELCETDRAGLGIFISHLGISGVGWRYGEGKRRKLFLSHKIPIISFKISELACLSLKGYNFYTIIKKKYQELVDELDYDGAPIKNLKKDNPEFSKFLIDTIRELKKIDIISETEKMDLENRVLIKYRSEEV